MKIHETKGCVDTQYTFFHNVQKAFAIEEHTTSTLEIERDIAAQLLAYCHGR